MYEVRSSLSDLSKINKYNYYERVGCDFRSKGDFTGRRKKKGEKRDNILVLTRHRVLFLFFSRTTTTRGARQVVYLSLEEMDVGMYTGEPEPELCNNARAMLV